MINNKIKILNKEDYMFNKNNIINDNNEFIEKKWR